jgi:hypothetical protein
LRAMQLYADSTGDLTVWDFLPKESWERLRAQDIRAHIWVNHELDSWGTADALRHYGMGENIPFEELLPGGVINLNRTTGTGHAVVFLAFIDEDGNEYDTHNANVIGFKYFSSQGGYATGTGGFDFRYAIFETETYARDGYPEMPYKRDVNVIRSDNQQYLNTGMMFHPDNWMPTAKRSALKTITDGPNVSFFDALYFDGRTIDDEAP